ncbi:hypothetical protein B0I35DRAFT_479578 [Stachybotrys elegans]|uniref:Amidoligase enzyme n=1 Tax=Stachybotrys elegans TaxID=80388 RepID=A0A8K0SPU9_9HYPO|nr:hypothetical protein B0I35DRAFT_479578 [Stachybotrys elegans]
MSDKKTYDTRFGIEIEFCLITPSAEREDVYASMEGSMHARASLAVQLASKTDLPIAVKCEHLRHLEGMRCFNCYEAPVEVLIPNGRVYSQRRPETETETDDATMYRYNMIQSEYLFGTKGIDKHHRRRATEIASQIFDHDELEAGLPKMAQIVEALRTIDMPVVADEGCGLHIHVGPKSGMTLQYAQRVISLAIMLEYHLIDKFLPPSRKESKYSGLICNVSNVTKGKINYIMSRVGITTHWLLNNATEPNSRSKKHFPVPLNDNIKKIESFVHSIWRVDDWELLTCFISEGSIVAGIAIADREDESKKTIEFRYPQMNFLHSFMVLWASLAVKLGDIASLELDDFVKYSTALARALNEHAGKEDCWQHLLQALDLGHQIPEWTAQIARHDAGEAISMVDDRFFLKRPE